MEYIPSIGMAVIALGFLVGAIRAYVWSIRLKRRLLRFARRAWRQRNQARVHERVSSDLYEQLQERMARDVIDRAKSMRSTWDDCVVDEALHLARLRLLSGAPCAEEQDDAETRTIYPVPSSGVRHAS